jgi:hypothetical protein
VSQVSDCKFLYEHTDATATCMFYVNRLLAMSLTKATAMFMSYRLLVISCNGDYGHVHILSTSCYEEASAPFMPYTIDFRHDLEWSLATTIALCPKISIRSTGLYLVCWMSSHEERFRLHPESLHLV